MIIEAVGSLIFIIIVVYLAWRLHKSGKQIIQEERELERNKANR